MNKEFIKHEITFNNGDVVKHKTTDMKLVVIETKHGYDAPYAERVICTYWHPSQQEFKTDKFLHIELELITYIEQ